MTSPNHPNKKNARIEGKGLRPMGHAMKQIAKEKLRKLTSAQVGTQEVEVAAGLTKRHQFKTGKSKLDVKYKLDPRYVRKIRSEVDVQKYDDELKTPGYYRKLTAACIRLLAIYDKNKRVLFYLMLLNLLRKI